MLTSVCLVSHSQRSVQMAPRSKQLSNCPAFTSSWHSFPWNGVLLVSVYKSLNPQQASALEEGGETLSKRTVRSAWKVFHCRQERKMTSAATGRFWWKPRSSAGQSNAETPRSDYYQSHLKMLTVSWYCRL